MANYFVIDNTFRPYSFDELVKPYQMYGEAYKQQEALLDAAREKEFSPDNLDQEQDRVAYEMYNNAASGLKAASDELAMRGLSSGLRSRIRTTARDYQTTMNNLNQAQERLIAERDRRAKLGPDYVFQNENIRIGDFLNGASPNQRGESLTAITNDIATEFARRAKGVSEDGWSKLVDSKGKLIGGYYDVTTRSGLEAGQLDLILNTDEDTWQAVLNNSNIPVDQKRNLQRFRDVIASKKASVGFDDFDSAVDKEKIQRAINLGATAGLVTETHSYKEDKGYSSPLAWAQHNLNVRKYNDALAEAEAPYTHSDETKPSPANRTGMKPGWAVKNGKLQYQDPNSPSSSSSGSGSRTDYLSSTPGITVYQNGQKSTYTSWDKVNAGTTEKGTFRNRVIPGPKNLSTVAIEDITDPDIKKELLSRINVSTTGKNNDEVNALVMSYLPILKQITVKVQGDVGDEDYAWAIEDKIPRRNTEEGEGVGLGEDYDANSKDLH